MSLKIAVTKGIVLSLAELDAVVAVFGGLFNSGGPRRQQSSLKSLRHHGRELWQARIQRLAFRTARMCPVLPPSAVLMRLRVSRAPKEKQGKARSTAGDIAVRQAATSPPSAFGNTTHRLSCGARRRAAAACMGGRGHAVVSARVH